MTSADKAIRYSTIAAVVIVAGVAASFSYLHALDVINAHSRPSRLNYAFPLTVDGMLYGASMVLLNDARRGLRASRLAYVALGIGISATVTVNVVSGLRFGPVGAIISAWPAVALVFSYELLMIIVRRSATPVRRPARAKPAGAEAAAPAPAARSNGHGAPQGGREASELYAAELARGEVPSVRRVRREMHLGQPRAQQVQSYLSALVPSTEGR